jgi:hypothetical protein
VATVNPITIPSLSSLQWVNGAFGFQIDGVSGPDCAVQTSTNLGDPNWHTLFTTNSPALPFQWTDSSIADAPLKFYRVLIGP